MRITVRLPKVVPTVYDELEECPNEGCDGQHFKPHSLKGKRKAVRDVNFRPAWGHRFSAMMVHS